MLSILGGDPGKGQSVRLCLNFAIRLALYACFPGYLRRCACLQVFISCFCTVIFQKLSFHYFVFDLLHKYLYVNI